MFTVSSTTRKANLYLIVALAITIVLILAFVVAPSIAAPKATAIPVSGASEFSDYYQRHLELRGPARLVVERTGDFALRHAELSQPAAMTVDRTDYFARHPELRASSESNDLSDYFLRH
jgi:hypothetical protein